MLTIFCSPKPFADETAWNQANALASWRTIDPAIEIIIFGSPLGAAAAAAQVGAVVVPEIESSPTGAPSFNAMADYARLHGRHDLQVYVNADILLNRTLLAAMLVAHDKFADRFLLVGERMDLMKGTRLDASQTDWFTRIPSLVQEHQLISHGPTGTDYFGFVRGVWQGLPPVFMGRGLCDLALLHYCFNQQIEMIDATLTTVAIHQYHDYQHVTGGFKQVFEGEDKAMMMQAHDLRHSLPTLADANWRFDESRTLVLDRYRRRTLRRVELALRYRFHLEYAALAVRAVQRLMGKRMTLPRQLTAEHIIQAWMKVSL